MLKFHIFWLSLLGLLLAFKVFRVAPEDKSMVTTLENSNIFIGVLVHQEEFRLKDMVRANPRAAEIFYASEHYRSLFDSTLLAIEIAENIESIQKASYDFNENIKIHAAKTDNMDLKERLDRLVEDESPLHFTLNQYRSLIKNKILVKKLWILEYYSNKFSCCFCSPSIMPVLNFQKNPNIIEMTCSTHWSRKYSD